MKMYCVLMSWCGYHGVDLWGSWGICLLITGCVVRQLYLKHLTSVPDLSSLRN